MHVCWQTSVPCMLFLTKQDNFYHKICGDLAEENAFVLFINLTVVMSAANQYFDTLNWPLFCTSQFQNCPFTICTSPIIHLVCLQKLWITVFLNFSWVLQWSWEKSKDNAHAKSLGANKVYYRRCTNSGFTPSVQTPSWAYSRTRKKEKACLLT